ncbi:hypothetical protein ACU19_09165 [Actinobaculum suis]|uniref:response regulator n=1 Tax=Actinobaculum suis TaxID=1657 RepID=UPI00066FF298|nr:response regulator transcription factor [Actinobaculum suis]KMY22578.1 hypothetical protein ACU19_09165 [Actinobaculum suis]
MSSKIRVALVDDDQLVRISFSLFLNTLEDISVSWAAASGKQALELLQPQMVDVLLLDVDMPGMDGIETARAVRALHPELPIVILTAFLEEDALDRALKAGVNGFLTKDSDPEEVLYAIRRAKQGKNVVAAIPTQLLSEAYQGSLENRKKYADFVAAVENLPSRLEPIFTLLLEGMPNKNIARELDLAETTVRSYVSELLEITRCQSRTELAITAVKSGVA